MSAPPDFLGMALGFINQQKQRRANAREQAQQNQAMQIDQQRFEMQAESQREQTRQAGLAQASTALQESGGDFNYAKSILEATTHGDYPSSYLEILKGGSKLIKKQKEKEQFASGAAGELPTLAAQSLRGEDVNPALGRLQQGALGAFGPQESGDAIGRLMTQFQAIRGGQREAGIAGDAAARADAAEHDRRLRIGASVEVGKQKTLETFRGGREDFALIDKETGEQRTVFGYEKARAMVEKDPEKWAITTKPSKVGGAGDTFGGSRSPVAKIEDAVSTKDKALTRAQRLRSMMDTNPELFGASGGLLSSAKGVMGTISDVGKMPIRAIRDSGLQKNLEGLRNEYARDLDEMRTKVGPDGKPMIDPKAYHYFAKVFKGSSGTVGAVDVLSGMQVYDAAKLNDPSGKVSDADWKSASNQVGVRGYNPTLDYERAKERQDEFITQLHDDLDFDVKRLERVAEGGTPTTIRREDLRSVGKQSQPAVQLTPEQQAIVNSILGGSR